MLTAVEQEERHVRAARLLVDSGAEFERVAAHLLRTTPAADEGVVLDAPPRGARQRSPAGPPRVRWPTCAAHCRKPPAGSKRVDVLFELGTAETLVSAPAAVEHLLEAHELIEDPRRRADAAFLPAASSIFGSPPGRVRCGSSPRPGRARLRRPRTESPPEAALILNAIHEPAHPTAAGRRAPRSNRSRNSDTTAGEKMLLALLGLS